MIMANREFLENRNIKERNSLSDLVQNISPDSDILHVTCIVQLEEVDYVKPPMCE